MVPVCQRVLIRRGRLGAKFSHQVIAKQLSLLRRRESTVEVLKVERGPGVPVPRQEGMAQFAPNIGADPSGVLERGPHSPAEASRNGVAVDAVQTGVPQGPGIASIAGESLVASLPRQDHRDVLTSQLRHKVKGYAGGPNNGLVFMPDQFRESVEELPAAHANLVVHGSDMFGDYAGIGKLAIRCFLITHRKRLDGFAPNLGHQSRDRARIDTAAKKDP